MKLLVRCLFEPFWTKFSASTNVMSAFRTRYSLLLVGCFFSFQDKISFQCASAFNSWTIMYPKVVELLWLIDRRSTLENKTGRLLCIVISSSLMRGITLLKVIFVKLLLPCIFKINQRSHFSSTLSSTVSLSSVFYSLPNFNECKYINFCSSEKYVLLNNLNIQNTDSVITLESKNSGKII